ncbi:hypothetical protein [Dyadobacter sandarakinus]|uniref:Uncharacterized protein n=1 Tax=Dyadobacter sandarakinus TaxID=2747268 RepID=A0ABX7I3Y0_9BACT|nr:hypothetical protein [Dyadobacter sandarakinus]QRR00554.1 hypothetical protein HWI92_06365 [Dyadobacter sandarakinus]
MKPKTIKFFSPEENAPKTETKSQAKPGGYISGSGKLVFPSKTLEELGIEPDAAHFKIGTQDGKRKMKYLYLIPTTDADSFSLVKSGRGYVVPLSLILQKGGIDFANTKHEFVVTLFNYEEGVTGFELELTSNEEKPEYTGKRRGRKPKSETVAE